MRKIIVAMIAVCVAALARPALAQQTTGNISGRIVDTQGAAMPGVTVTGRHTQTGFTRADVSDAEGVYRLSALPVGTYDLVGRAPGLHQGREQGDHRQRRAVARHRDDDDGRGGVGERDGDRRDAAHRDPLLVGRRRRRRRPDREPAAQRPPVRQPGGDDSGRRPRVPLGSDQEHAVLAADRRRQRPQRELSDRRRRQQRRHRRRAAAALPARSDSGVQLRHAALQGGVRPEQRRRDEHRDEERDQPVQRQRVLALPRQVPQRADPLGRDQRGREGRLPAVSVRRIVRRADRAQPRVLLRAPSSARSRTPTRR